MNTDELVKQYCNLIQKDKEYFQTYQKADSNTFEGQLKNALSMLYLWRSIPENNQLEELKQCFENAKSMKALLDIREYYFDELIELEESENKNYHELSSKSLQKVMLQQDCKKQLKDCIELYLMSDTVCEQICNLSIKI